MNPKKFQIFVSSTYKDLSAIRTSVMQSIQKLLHFPVGMEQFSADDDEQWQIIEETIQQTDYYICIIGHRYGSLSKDGRSFTEKEWDYAKKLGIPIMSFVQDRDAKTSPAERESDPALIGKLDKFIAKATGDKMVEFWDEAYALNAMIVTALAKAFLRKPRPGWIRASSEDVAEALARLSNENRALQDRLERLTSQKEHSRPNIITLLNGKNKLTLSYPADEHLKLSVTPKVKAIDWHALPDDLKQFLTSQEAERYNKALPTPEKIKSDQKLINLHERFEQTKSDLEITIFNDGKAKARQLYVDLIFPDSVFLFEKYEYDKLTPPEHELPDNPLPKAEEKLRQSRKPVSVFDAYNSLTRMHDFTGIHHSLITPNISELVAAGRRGRSYDVKDNKLSIHLDDLMHTREEIFTELIIIPKVAGIFEITGTAICEEMNEPITFQIPLIITETK